MPGEKEKYQLLRDQSYYYHFKRGIYVNRQVHKVFSREAIDDHDIAWLRQRIREDRPKTEWTFYFNQVPDDDVKREIEGELG